MIRKGKRELRLSNLDKVFWPDEGITKGDLIDYYRAGRAGARAAPANRPFTMRRYPDGTTARLLPEGRAEHMPDWIPTYRALVSPREKARRSARSRSRS